MYETSKRYFRATFVDAASTDMQITIEFEAPFPITEEIDYSQIAIDSLRGLNIWAEVGINLTKSFNQLAFGLSYPFADLGG